MTRYMTRLGWLCAAHPWRVITGWVLIVAVAFALAATIGRQPAADYNAPASSESAGHDFMAEKFPDAAGADARVVVSAGSRPPTATDLAALSDQLRAVDGVSSVSPPRVSPAGDTALINVQFKVPATHFHGPQGRQALGRAVAPSQQSGLRVDIGGEIPENYTADGGHVERDAVLAAGCLLLVVSGSIAAAGIAPAVALFGVGTGLALMLIVAGFLPVNTTAPLIGTAFGIGLGGNYALLFLARFRAYLPLGPSATDAAAATNGSVGRSIAVAGTAVLVPLLALGLVGIPQFATYGYALAVMVAAVTLAAVTLVPALCGLAGHRLVRWRAIDRFLPRVPLAQRWSRHVARRPTAWAVAGLLLLLLLAAPVLGMRTWPRDAGSLSDSDTARRAYDVITADFGHGANGPFTVGVDTRRVSPSQLADTMGALRDKPYVAKVFGPVFNADHSAAVFSVEPTTAPRDQETAAALRQVDELLPPGMYVTGLTAYFVDVAEQVAQRLWPLIIAVVGLAAVVLAIAFRAPVIAIATALMKLLAVAATYGVVVAIFQWGWGTAVLGLPGAVPMSSWAAILVFVILFGLATDYEVFIVSRIDEERRGPDEARLVVPRGFGSVAHVVVIAAAVVMAIFGAFILDPDIVVKMMCVGVVMGLLIDVVVVRMVVLPATLALLGETGWWWPARDGAVTQP